MAFHYVDRIHEFEPFKSIRGIKNVTRSEPFFYWLPNGVRALSPAVVSEALAQLGGWLKIASTDFTRRPVLLADERSDYHSMVEAGDQLELYVEVLDFGDDVVVTKGEARVRGELVTKSECVRGYLLPLDDFSSPEVMRKSFKNLFRPEFKSVSRIGAGATPLPPVAGHSTFETLKFVDGILEHIPGKKVVGFKNVSACETWFESHFPYKPCVPGVLLLTFLGEVCQYLVRPELNTPIRSRALIPTYIKNVRFRKFVEPGDQCIMTAEVTSGDLTKEHQDVTVRATIQANDNRVMQADMGFRTMFAGSLLDPMRKWTRRDFSAAAAPSSEIVGARKVGPPGPEI
jgi:3-hydroxymyristoyl/3-hydroxydecanoyl-(acyl carrier protein) dehydratase